jgi:hypothetical protein
MTIYEDFLDGYEDETNLPTSEWSPRPFGKNNRPKVGIGGHPDESKYTRAMAKEDKNKLEAFLAKRGLASKGYNDWYWDARAGFVRGRRSNKPQQDMGNQERVGSGGDHLRPEGNKKKAKGSGHLHQRPHDRTPKPKHGGVQ